MSGEHVSPVWWAQYNIYGEHNITCLVSTSHVSVHVSVIARHTASCQLCKFEAELQEELKQHKHCAHTDTALLFLENTQNMSDFVFPNVFNITSATYKWTRISGTYGPQILAPAGRFLASPTYLFASLTESLSPICPSWSVTTHTHTDKS